MSRPICSLRWNLSRISPTAMMPREGWKNLRQGSNALPTPPPLAHGTSHWAMLSRSATAGVPSGVGGRGEAAARAAPRRAGQGDMMEHMLHVPGGGDAVARDGDRMTGLAQLRKKLPRMIEGGRRPWPCRCTSLSEASWNASRRIRSRRRRSAPSGRG